MTSNVDALFARNGFDPNRVFTPQGDYGRLQCLRPCTRETWEWKPVLDALIAAIDPSSGAVTDRTLIPSCPSCGGDVFLNVCLGHNYIQDPYLPVGDRLVEWLEEIPNARLVVLELGAGFSTPGVIRWPGETITHYNPNAFLIRVNPTHPQTPAKLNPRALSVRASATDLIRALQRGSSSR